MVKRFLSLLLISVCLGDTLILKDKTVYTGWLVKYDNDEIKFKVSLPTDTLPSTVSLASSRIFTGKLSININDIQELKLWNGTKVFENGILMISELSIRQYILIAKEKLFLRDATICCSLIIILGLTAFFNSDIDLGFSLKYNNANN